MTLQQVFIYGLDNSSYNWAGIICLGDATIILSDRNTVWGFESSQPGIYVPPGHTLTIRGDGSLETKSNGYGAGIGAASNGIGLMECGNIVIEGGTITATGGNGAAGIGSSGSASSSCGNITISGGTVTATGGAQAAGIGSGQQGTSCGNITISGGSVTAKGSGNYVTGIGAGLASSCGDITICGGTVIATGTDGAAGIGSNHESTCGNISLSDCTVEAKGGTGAAGIGSGLEGGCLDITISDNVLSVTATKGDYANSIGKGAGGSCGTVTIGGAETGSISKSPFTYNPSVDFNYTVHYDSNGGTGVMADQIFLYGFAQNLTTNTFTCNDHSFLGWSTTPDGDVVYTDGQSVSDLTNTANATVTLYAKWTCNFDLSTITANFTAIKGDVLTGTLGGNYKISIADGATVTLRNATINITSSSAGLTCLGNANIILEGSNTVTSSAVSYPGIMAGGSGTTLTISGSGSLTASGGNYAAGIGSASVDYYYHSIGNLNYYCGNITISGGTITATGGLNGAGIGGGGSTSCGDITITGGTIVATGGNYGSGIGSGAGSNNGGDNSVCGAITITGGTVTATGGFYSAGIGSGGWGQFGSINIGNGVTSVKASKGSSSPSSIGRGINDKGSGTVTIDGIVTGDIAQSPFTYNPSVSYKYTVHFDSNGGTGTMADQELLSGINFNLSANIFTYYEGHSFLGWNTESDGTGITYTDGQSVSSVANAAANTTVTLYAQWNHNIDLSTLTGNYLAQNGDVLTGTLGGNYKITIADGATVTLNNVTINGVNETQYKWSGITCLGDATIILEGKNMVKGFYVGNSGIYVPENKTLHIQGSGQLNVSAYDYGCGIETYGNVIIESGTIIATGGKQATGIGSRNQAQSSGNITITGGTVNATGGYRSAAIGSATYASCGNITISGGFVTATKGSTGPNSIGAGGFDGTCGTVTIGGVVTGNISTSPFVTYPYTVTFDANGGEGTMADQTLMYNVAKNLTANTFAKTEGGFIGWSTQADGSGTAYDNGQSVKNLVSEMGATATLFAQWQGGDLADGTAYKITEDFEVSTATYTKSLESRMGKHQAWFVPFDYTITSDDVEKFNFYKINMIANAPAPGEGESSDDMWVFLTKVGAGTVLHANMPYVFKPLVNIGSYDFTTTNATLKAKNTGVLAKVETMEDTYSFYGVYENTSPSTSDPFYYVNYLGTISFGNASSVVVGPYRWIIRKTSKFGDTTAYARNMHFFEGDEDSEATSISEEQMVNSVKFATAAGWYTLDGRKLSEVPTQRGVYINNGRKVVIR